MDDEQQRLMDIFNEARAKAAAEERDAYLRSACGDDDSLRRQVEVLLHAHEQAGGFLKETIHATAPANDLAIERAGVMIGRYKLLQEIGEGGFGQVFMAEQKEPVHRKVALKIIKAGMDTKEVIARFEAERQALALMDHPNVAQVFDGGVTQAGRPYFVMELVKGVPFTDYCDRGGLPMAARLQLFMQVCHAVQHAHQKGIIHRDLKPSNILITMIDGKPVPKIIDFGVAKALGQQLTEKTLFTAFGQIVGTPLYMSPEQTAISGVDVDTRSDVYSLGVLLYELLTGVTPIDAETVRKAGLDEMRRMIRETDPPVPSTRLRTLGDKLTEVAQRRHAEPSVLARQVHGDLDWIVGKAREKDRARRYETVNALQADIQRHLEHQPVMVGPPSVAYRTKKYVRRHRMGVALAASVTVALIVGLIFAFIGFMEAKRERDRAVAAEQQALKARDRAMHAEEGQVAILNSVVGGSVKDSAMIPMLEEGARIAWERLGPTNETYLILMYSLANHYGALGKWTEAAERYRRLTAAKPGDHWLLYLAHAAALAAGQRETARDLSQGMLSWFASTHSAAICERVARSVLLSPDPPSSLERAVEMAERAFRTEPASPWVRIAKGMAEYRLEQYAAAADLLAPIRHDSDPKIGCLAGYFLAMCRQQQGDTNAAQRVLKETNDRFATVLRTGDLGEFWHDSARNLVARAEAERLILGQEASPAPAVLAQEREQVARLLRDGYSLAEKGEWKESAQAYAAALQHPGFHWKRERDASVWRCLGPQMGTAFVRAGDPRNHERLCRLIIDAEFADRDDPEPGLAELFARSCFVNGRSLPDDLQELGLAMGRFAVDHSGSAGGLQWTAEIGGVAEYYLGDAKRSVELLLNAEETPEIACQGAAMAYRAMALKKLGHDAEATGVLQGAETLLAVPLNTRMGGQWWDWEFCQFALEQARQLIKASSKP